MKKLPNTLYVTSEGAWLRMDGKNVVVEIDGAERGRAPVHLLSHIVCFGQVAMSPPLMSFCAESDVSITFLSVHGRFLARIEGPQTGNVALRRAQHVGTSTPVASLLVARAVVLAKTANQRGVIRRHLRDYGSNLPAPVAKDLDRAQQSLSHVMRHVLSASDLDTLRGPEGDAASTYFADFNYLIRNRDPVFGFAKRIRRPPRDATNAVLSFLYVLLAQDCRAACETTGLDPQMGFLHKDRPGSHEPCARPDGRIPRTYG